MDEHMKRRLDKQKKLFKQLGIQLDALSIHEKEFPTKLRGYDAEEVDRYLDDVIRDYERFYATISDLMDKWQEQQIMIRDLKAGVRPEPEQPTINTAAVHEIVVRLETDLALLKKRIRPEQNFFID
ncbi:DivIVA domain-containing protein [Paenibacillus dakarensis]|uniref:DivIVA domain-containing protein n=1 Tax=Paenibacillus dakarensis TaxID=1527293 RepID=UPI0006D58D76|nr:DivIVA domain-containing protein [Paenibacillus dakarensis]